MKSFLLAVPLAIPLLASAADPDLIAAYGQLRTAALDPNHVAVAENVTIQKSTGTFQLKNGTLFALQPALDKVAGLVFVGDGVFTFQPPSDAERKHLARLTGGSSTLEEPFKQAVFLFTDSTFTDLSAGAMFKAGNIDPKAASALSDIRKDFRNDLKTNVEARLLAGLCGPDQAFFLGQISGQKHGKLLFTVDAMNGDPVLLTHYGSDLFDEWSEFVPAGTPAPENRALIHTTKIDLDTQLEKSGRLEADAVEEVTALRSGARMLLVQLAPHLRVSKVSLGGSELKFIQEAKDKDADLWLILPAPLVQGQQYSLKLAYAGDSVVEKAGNGNFFVGERERWYPKLDTPGDIFNDRSLYHMKFRSPKDLTLVATGKPTGKSTDGGVSVTEWETEAPYTVVGFNLGDFKTKSLSSNGHEITVYANRDIGDELKSLQVLLDQNPEVARALGITTGGFETTGLINQALGETANALNVFTAYFGPLPSAVMSISQQPASNFGQSWPTLVFMPYTSFLDSTTRHQLQLDDQARSRQFFDEVGAHEISHQWWGHLVSPRDYHDAWLSEGFAQFSAGLYLHRTSGEKDLRSFLAQDKQFLLAPLPNTSERADDAGPIWLGSHLDTAKTEGAYRLIYAKGDLVLHMLRMMLYDWNRGDDSRFIAMMRDFTQTYAGKSASTEDFKAICDKHFGMDMGWFFNQWVYETGIPKISIQYSVKDGADGPLLVLDVKQQGVPEGFRSVVPFLIKAKSGAAASRFSISKADLHAEVKLPVKPDSIEFNPLDAALCELDVKKK